MYFELHSVLHVCYIYGISLVFVVSYCKNYSNKRKPSTWRLSVCSGGGGGRAQSRYSILTLSH